MNKNEFEEMLAKALLGKKVPITDNSDSSGYSIPHFGIEEIDKIGAPWEIAFLIDRGPLGGTMMGFNLHLEGQEMPEEISTDVSPDPIHAEMMKMLALGLTPYRMIGSCVSSYLKVFVLSNKKNVEIIINESMKWKEGLH